MAKAWLVFRANGARWRVYLVDASDVRVEASEGVTRWQEHAVFIDDALPFDRRLAVLGHELVHVAMSMSNKELSAAVLHCDPDDADDAEEALAAYIGPTIGEVLLQLVNRIAGSR